MIQITGITRENGKVIQVGVNGFIADDVDENETIYFDRVVRCGDCKHYHNGICEQFTTEACRYDVRTEPYDYCSYGEVKEN